MLGLGGWGPRRYHHKVMTELGDRNVHVDSICITMREHKMGTLPILKNTVSRPRMRQNALAPQRCLGPRDNARTVDTIIWQMREERTETRLRCWT